MGRLPISIHLRWIPAGLSEGAGAFMPLKCAKGLAFRQGRLFDWKWKVRG